MRLLAGALAVVVLFGCGGNGASSDTADERPRTVSEEDGASGDARLWSPWVGRMRESCRFYGEEAEELEFKIELVERPAQIARFFDRVAAHYKRIYQELKFADPPPPAQRTEASLIERHMRDLARLAKRLSAAAAARDDARGRFLIRKTQDLIEETNFLAKQVSLEPCWLQL